MQMLVRLRHLSFIHVFSAAVMQPSVSKQQHQQQHLQQQQDSLPGNQGVVARHQYQQQVIQNSLPNQSKRTMPPPQKAPPRRKSISRSQQNVTVSQPSYEATFEATTSVPLCNTYTVPTKMNSPQVAMAPSVPRVQQHQVMNHQQIINQIIPVQMQMDQSQQVSL